MMMSYKDALMHTARATATDSPLLDPWITQCMLLQARQLLLGFEGKVMVCGSLTSIKESAMQQSKY